MTKCLFVSPSALMQAGKVSIWPSQRELLHTLFLSFPAFHRGIWQYDICMILVIVQR